jgi:hypothetical protein
MRELFELMAAQYGVATTSQARALGLTRRAEVRMIAGGALWSPARDVLAAGGAPVTFAGRAMAAVLSPGATAVSHGAAARLHGLDGFDHYDRVDVIGSQGANPHSAPGTVVHYTRGPILDHVVAVDKIPVMSIPSTLALLAPLVGIGPTARALDSALRMGLSADELRTVALAWRRRGRRGPPALLMLLGERVDNRLPRSWFQRVAARVLATAGIRLADGYAVRDRRGILVAELDLAEPVRRVGVAQHRGSRDGVLRQLGWVVIDVRWTDLGNAERVTAQVLTALRSRDPSRRSAVP